MVLVATSTNLGDHNYSHEQIAAVLSPKIQQLIILPTEQCNFRCTYCYEDFAIGKMRPAVQESLERYMDHRIPELRHLSLQWFGGEPLLARSVVLRLASYAARLCKMHNVVFQGSMTTNGFLLNRDLFEDLLSYNQNFFQITLDGWQDVHDAVRKQAGGRGSFNRIWENLLNLRNVEGEFEIQLRIHVRYGNAASLRTLMENISEHFGSDKRFSLDFQHLRDLGGEGGKTIENPVTFEEMRSLEQELRGIIADSSTDNSDQPVRDDYALQEATYSRQSDRAGPSTSIAGSLPPSDICYAAKPNSLLIRSDGRIGKCTVALTDDRNTIGKINPDGTVTIDNGKLRPWIRGLSTLNRDELECPLGGMFLQQELAACV